MWKNSFNSLSDSEQLSLIEVAERLFEDGCCCPIACGGGAARPCGAVEEGIKVASYAVHDGEEPPVSGWFGAGNIFFSGCSAKCVFCQNWPISQENNGKVYSIDEFCENVRKLLKKKVHNIGLVTADQYLSRVLRAFYKIRDDLNVPVVYNCNGAQTEKLFEIILKVSDIFLFDVKYASNGPAGELCDIKNYADVNRRCLDMLLERDLKWEEDDMGILRSGLIIRHLVLPNYIESSLEVINLLQEYRERGLNFKISLMSQYFPAYKAVNMKKIERKLKKNEYDAVVELVEKYDFDGWIQGLEE